ncbi:tripartite tricarboxylate transporter substrate binding protein [Aquabacter sp. CN5-332]|uniref:Bug family tripartite tricarboxylate transporter substrate binding protein n=1 Tax=Aquabacter sp. CN5-332 TaxID=3156608 RepID=UPI0032B4B87C
MITRRNLLAMTGGAMLAGPKAAFAQAPYPSQAITMMVGYAAGGGVDIVGRFVADALKTALGQPVIVDNRPGAAGMIAARAVAKAVPDGYTLLMAASGEVAVNQSLYKDQMTYDPLRELAPVALVGIVPCIVVMAADSPVNTPAQFVAYARANKGKLSFSHGGLGNPQHLAGELLNKMAGTDILQVPYRGSNPAVADVATGIVTMSFSSIGAALPYIKAGKVKAVAVTSLERMPQLPDVLPLAEAGPELSGYEVLNWFGMFAPAGTPDPIVEKLNAVVVAALGNQELVDKLMVQGILPRPLSVAAFRGFVKSEAKKFGTIVADANLKL